MHSPITSTSPASAYVGIDQSITYGSSGTTILSSTAGITDTGTTLVLLASGQSLHVLLPKHPPDILCLTDALSAYQSATGAVSDSSTGLLKITQAQFDNLESLFFHIGDNTYEFTPNAQIWPRAVCVLFYVLLSAALLEMLIPCLVAQHCDWWRRRLHLPRHRRPRLELWRGP